ncbi:TetR/AcrR family transcriptional regulator [Kitasatospora purpeofusca]|uniref:TetR/AcrR family transcriptional regulator n=1 Tax=Kitasatospora purpeofusca TaxID=67352 RepID=UPI002A5AB712|nr:TetR/AcrR family transcriptional regulator [Kitasatospora purpeofusca]MDY0813117.1 TetR/AcrR family transcriptional regulator [Kitasatospora purpeofusca]
MTPHRPTLIADAAIALIAERGLRGLTHRAVDEEAALPAGSTSNLARTRAALLDLALARIVERETEGSPVTAGVLPDGPAARELLVQGGADLLHRALTGGRTLTLARLELALEATRRPELRAGYDRLGARFTDLATALLARCGSTDAAADARRLIRWCDGVLFNSTAGSGHDRVPTPEELRGETARYLAALLDDG